MTRRHLAAKCALLVSSAQAIKECHTFQCRALALNTDSLFYYLFLPFYFLPIIHPIIMTLGTHYIFSGTGKLISGGTPISGFTDEVRY